jgi:hypothetical protein
MDPIINQYNFFKNIKLTPEGYVEMVLVDYVAPKEGGISQYDTFRVIGLDEEGRLKVTIKPQ